MELSNDKIREYTKRLLLSRLRILCNNGFYGLLLMHMNYGLDEECQTAYTDGKNIRFSPIFMDSLNDDELDFVMMHEILHVVLQHCFRGENKESKRYNIACDIVVNSNILKSNKMDLKSISIHNEGPSMHIAPDGKEGFEYTAEQVYEMLPPMRKDGKTQKLPGNNKDIGGKCEDECDSQRGGFALGRAQHEEVDETKYPKDKNQTLDDHTKWREVEDDDQLRDVWVKRLQDVCKIVEIRDTISGRGTLPMFAKRMLKELDKSQIDWRTILNEFIQEEVVDYSFTPPDRRFEDSPFFLPDFNETDIKPEKILFMIDTSASMTDNMVAAAYTEVKGAIDQFDGKLVGWLGFFDAAIIEPQPFESKSEFKMIKAAGGGGTDFQIIFEYVHKHMQDDLPISIIIFTDGYAPFPKEHLAMNIPVLWLLNNEKAEPPWGKIARIKI